MEALALNSCGVNASVDATRNGADSLPLARDFLNTAGAPHISSPVDKLDCIAALKALGEETRLRMLRLLFVKPLTVNEISDRLKVSQYNTSKHLRIMRQAGLLESEKRGKFHLYSLSSNLKRHVSANNNVLDLGCCTFRLDKLPK